ncbi:hypothetical protein LINPERPRIM_LOCUS17387 [Linum perenne]
MMLPISTGRRRINFRSSERGIGRSLSNKLIKKAIMQWIFSLLWVMDTSSGVTRFQTLKKIRETLTHKKEILV